MMNLSFRTVLASFLGILVILAVALGSQAKPEQADDDSTVSQFPRIEVQTEAYVVVQPLIQTEDLTEAPQIETEIPPIIQVQTESVLIKPTPKA